MSCAVSGLRSGAGDGIIGLRVGVKGESRGEDMGQGWRGLVPASRRGKWCGGALSVEDGGGEEMS